jgi:hypothetical protein
MSSSQAQVVLKREIQKVIDSYTRGTLDEQVHVIDISYKSLLASNSLKDNSNYSDNYNEFYFTVAMSATKVGDYLTAVKHVTENKGTCILLDRGYTLLINKNFDTARNFITKISNAIPDNEDFGIAFRTRDLEDVQITRALYSAAGSSFLVFQNGKYKVKEVKKLRNSSKYALVTVRGYGNITEVEYKEKASDVTFIKTNNLSQFKNKEVELISGSSKIIRVKARVLSVLDLGHGQGTNAAQATPLGEKFRDLLNIDLSPGAKDLIRQYIKELVDLHNVVSFTFHNTSTNEEAKGFVVLSIQNYARNNILAISEGKLLNKVVQNIDLLSIPGSNTILQDGIEIVKNKVIAALSKKPVKGIQKHQPVKGKAKGDINATPPNTNSTKIKRKSVTVDNSPSFSSGKESLNLTSLQNLINQQLQDVISANMGDGTQRSVLNYRTGRFAGSANVERMSESREGMITAFYSYMKNPYQTFEPGFRQGSPRTRDPKLLIAKSIREIAGTQVANRLRAVSI